MRAGQAADPTADGTTPGMNILSIQSWVAYGHVGNAAAVFPLQSLGHEVWAIHTVQFSNHTGYGAWTGMVTPPSVIADLVDGMAARGALGGIGAVLSGYVGDPATGDAILSAVGRVRAAHAEAGSGEALWCCDPVIGDVGRGVFVRPGVAEFFTRQAVPQADILTPNLFELGTLTGREIATLPEALAAGEALAARMRPGGPRIVAVTSLDLDDTPADALDLLVIHGHRRTRLRTRRLAVQVNGAGDLIAALLLHHFADSADAAGALRRAAASVHGVLEATGVDPATGRGELALVAAREAIVRPAADILMWEV